MFLAIDIGNTNITLGIRLDNGWKEYRLITNVSLSYIEQYEALKQLASSEHIGRADSIAVSSVVPEITDHILNAAHQIFHSNPILIEPKWYPQIPITPIHSDEIGTDLMANALAMWEENGPHCLVIDFGTALTYTYINRNGIIDGVAITPGIKTSLEALTQKASKLHDISLKMPNTSLGLNTVDAMRSGILWGFVGQVKYMISKIRQEKGNDIVVMATGGLSEVLEPLAKHFDLVDRCLTLKGLYYFYLRVKSIESDARDGD